MSAAPDPDVVYFLMFEGWGNELQANRWHWAKRWSRTLPVVLVQPSQPRAPRSLRSSPEPRLPNVRVLPVKRRGVRSHEADVEIATGQLWADLERQGFERPLLWSYNPLLRPAYEALPAVARVYHATENYFAMDGVAEWIREEVRSTIRASDLTVAVSSGVVRGLEREVPGAAIVEVTNGCDFAVYSRGNPDAELAGLGARVAVYAGNLNERIDYELLLRAARARPGDVFAFAGPVSRLDRDDARRWKELAAMPNVRGLGEVDPARLPALYAAADVGLLPYKQTSFLVENAFPLKTLEMAATGLPVVSTPIEPLERLAEAIVVTSGGEAFVEALATSRRGLSAAAAAELVEVARRNDYDVKFEQVRALVAGASHPPERRDAPLAAAVAAWRANAWPDPLARAAAGAARLRLSAARLATAVLPEPLRDRVPAPLRAMFTRLLTPG